MLTNIVLWLSPHEGVCTCAPVQPPSLPACYLTGGGGHLCARVRVCVCATTIVHVSTNISEKGARERLCVARRASLCVRGRAVTAVGGAGSSQRVEGL